MSLDLAADAGSLTAALIDVASVSGFETELADAVDAALRDLQYLEVERHGNVVLARTDLGRTHRVVLAGHLDTVPIADNVPARREGNLLYGCGASDMKSGVAVMLRLAATLGGASQPPGYDVTYVFYDCEEIEAARNGLGRLARERPAPQPRRRSRRGGPLPAAPRHRRDPADDDRRVVARGK